MKFVNSKSLIAFFSAFVVLAGSFLITSEAYADFYDFRTEDGKWDGAVEIDAAEGNVSVDAYDLWMVHRSTGIRSYYGNDAQYLRVRLCSATSGNCTAYKQFDALGRADFVHVYGGKYNVDIIDVVSGFYFEGSTETRVWWTYP